MIVKRLVVVIGIVVALLLLLGGAGYWYVTNHKEQVLSLLGVKDGELVITHKVEEKPKVLKTINLSNVVLTLPTDGNSRSRFLVLDLAITSYDETADKTLLELEPQLRNALIEVFATKKYTDLKTMKGLPDLQKEVQEAFRKVVAGNGLETKIEAVLFTRVVLQ